MPPPATIHRGGDNTQLGGMLYATYPYSDPDSEACEIYGYSLALRNCILPITYICDCAIAVRDIQRGKAYCTGFEHTYCRIRTDVWWLLDDHGATVDGFVDTNLMTIIKTTAHCTWDSRGLGRGR